MFHRSLNLDAHPSRLLLVLCRHRLVHLSHNRDFLTRPGDRIEGPFSSLEVPDNAWRNFFTRLELDHEERLWENDEVQ